MQIFLILLFCFIFSCSEKRDSKHSTSGVNETDTLREISKPTTPIKLEVGALREDQSKAWFIPKGLKPDDSVVCILFFDPQGNGKRPLELYQKIAEKQGFILAASKISKNGMGSNETKSNAIQLLSEVTSSSGFKHLAFYAAGFSGGAKVALSVSNSLSNLKGTLYAGAASLNETPSKPMFGFAGNMDMNLADLVQFDANLPDNIPHFLKVWKGKHEWPAAEIFNDGFEWIKIKENSGSGALEKKRIDLQFQARRTKNLLEKESLLLEAKFLALELGRKDLENEDLGILQTRPAFIESKKSQVKELEDEIAMKELYSPAFFDKDISWWRNEIADLKAHKRHSSENLQDRLLGFFSLASYSLANKAMQEQDEKLAEKILEIYRLSDPENAEQAYLRAVFASRRKQNNLVFEALSEAVKLGFNDKNRVLQQAEFQTLIGNSEFTEIVSRIK